MVPNNTSFRRPTAGSAARIDAGELVIFLTLLPLQTNMNSTTIGIRRRKPWRNRSRAAAAAAAVWVSVSLDHQAPIPFASTSPLTATCMLQLAGPAFPEYDESKTAQSEEDVELMVGMGVFLLVFILVTIFYASPMPPPGSAKRRGCSQAQVARGHVSRSQMDECFHGIRRNKRCVK